MIEKILFWIRFICNSYGWLGLIWLLGCIGLFSFGWYLIYGKPKHAGKRSESLKLSTKSLKGDVPKRADLYNATIQLISLSENISWTRTTNFLFANSILMLAWATIFAGSRIHGTGYFLTLLALLGFLLSVLWAPFGSRSRKYLNRYREIGGALEQDVPPPLCDGPLNAGANFKFLRFEGMCRSQTLIVVVPLLFAAAFLFILLKSFCLLLDC